MKILLYLIYALIIFPRVEAMPTPETTPIATPAAQVSIVPQKTPEVLAATSDNLIILANKVRAEAGCKVQLRQKSTINASGARTGGIYK
jgi:hypothetical protein